MIYRFEETSRILKVKVLGIQVSGFHSPSRSRRLTNAAMGDYLLLWG